MVMGESALPCSVSRKDTSEHRCNLLERPVLNTQAFLGGLEPASIDIAEDSGWRSRISFRIRPDADSQLWMRLRRRCSRTCFQSLEVRPRVLVIRLNVEGLCIHFGCEVSPPGLLVRYS